ncbi:MAG: glycosyltransferase [Bacteroidetes bacterium]|jgi:cellulose synthase/poly-beta-1,6-N-acetylglucosamine synthase-like glycosyltransferase|nr:glycosyltransferase [Bacteroidota bacterium]
MEVICILSFALLLGYALLILFYLVGWLLIKEYKQVLSEPTQYFTILIPARNEAKVISDCLNSILTQEYPREKYEIIVIDDHSEDATSLIVKQFISVNPLFNIRLIALQEHLPHGNKKEGITLGVSMAKFEHILLTDADCLRGTLWIKSIAQFIQTKPTQMLYAPVFFSAENTFEKIQALEFAGLVGIGAAAIQLKNPNMCSAANLMFTKTAFEIVGGYKDNMHLASGDDEFLLHKVFKKYPNEVWFLKDRRTIVSTSPNASLDQLAQQRKRWVSKSTKYDERYITAILVGAYLFNLSIVVNLIVGIWQAPFFYVGIWQLFIKTLVEGLFLYQICAFFNDRKLIFLLPLAEPFHILYVLIIGIWANTKPFTWKNRTHH